MYFVGHTNISKGTMIYAIGVDLRNSPDPDNIFIDALRYEELDYGFTY